MADKAFHLQAQHMRTQESVSEHKVLPTFKPLPGQSATLCRRKHAHSSSAPESQKPPCGYSLKHIWSWEIVRPAQGDLGLLPELCTHAVGWTC